MENKIKVTLIEVVTKEGLTIYIHIRLKIKPTSVRIRSLS